MKILSKAIELWPQVIAHQRGLAVHPFFPLHGLLGTEALLGLTELTVSMVPMVSSAPVPPIGKVAELTAADLLELRKILHAGWPNIAVGAWAEKLIKFAEIKFPQVGGLHPTLRQPLFTATLLTSFFVDYWLITNDARFLNTSCKLLDYQTARWRGPGIGPGLPLPAAQALLCRNILLIEHGLRKL